MKFQQARRKITTNSYRTVTLDWVLYQVLTTNHSGWTLVTSAGQWPVSGSVTRATRRLRQVRAGESPLFLATCLSDLEDLGGWPGYGSKNGLPGHTRL